MDETVKKSRNIKNLLLEVTIRHIEKYGINKISLRKIAAECGVTHATIYKYYDNKNALISATTPYVLSNMHPYLRRAIKKSPESEPFMVLCTAYVRYMFKHPQYHYLLHPGTLSIQPPWPVQQPLHRGPYYENSYTEIIVDFFTRCKIPEKEYTSLFPLLSSMINGLILLLNKSTVVYHGDLAALVDIVIFTPLKLKPKKKRKLF